MKFQKPIKLIAFLLIFLSAVLFAQDKKIYILHTNNTNGALENCYCPDRPYGSVEKRAVYVSNFIKKYPNSQTAKKAAKRKPRAQRGGRK